MNSEERFFDWMHALDERNYHKALCLSMLGHLDPLTDPDEAQDDDKNPA